MEVASFQGSLNRSLRGLADQIGVVVSLDPSQQNVYTGRLTSPMFELVLRRARELAAVVAVGGSQIGQHAAGG